MISAVKGCWNREKRFLKESRWYWLGAQFLMIVVMTVGALLSSRHGIWGYVFGLVASLIVYTGAITIEGLLYLTIWRHRPANEVLDNFASGCLLSMIVIYATIGSLITMAMMAVANAQL